ncbi:hypothetical protein AGOR_G00007730 [Albula goreensis]|uniref:Uncharacterized protein n=1 Tax=Albula goreensis TaxID=1534307 RepID=A0A8T3E8R7_9TELE|nr:hypothetical protein AGOR_G00007730 [Albula goreensis]
MVSKEPNHLPSASSSSSSSSNTDKMVTVRSVLLNRDSPDIETRLKRRRNRTQQVRFKDLEDGVGIQSGRRRSGAEQGSPHPNRKSPMTGATEEGGRERAKEATTNGTSVVGVVRGDMAGTIGAVAAILARTPPHPLTPAPMRRTWAPPRPCSLTLPNPRRPCMSTAIQTSPSLQKPLPLSIAQTRSQSLGDFGGVESQEDKDGGGTQDGTCPPNHILCPAPPQDCLNPASCQSNLPQQHPLLHRHQCLRPSTSAAVSPPLMVNSRHGTPSSHPNRVEPPCCPPTSPVMNSNGPPFATPLHPRKKRLGRAAPHTAQDIWRGGERERGDRRDSPLPPPPPPPPPYTPRREGCCGPGPPLRNEPPTKGGSGEQEPAGRGSALPAYPRRAGTPGISRRQDPASVLPCTSPQSPGHGQTLPPSAAQHTIFCTEPQANTPKTPSNMSGNAPCNPHSPALPSGQCPLHGAWDPCLSRTTDATLTPGQAETLKQVQELLGGLVSGAKGKLELARAREKLLGPQGPLHDIGTLHSQLQSLEGVLETSQNTIKVLLDVIQDLEKKEAERDGRHSYRTGQDIENCGTCRDCACIIYR